ncbi:MAG: peptidase domain-containing ABC transporter [Proteobacteria bacterium]|nr:peptidase domain-containing ABC transporter [Pseudomonadota bacterium]
MTAAATLSGDARADVGMAAGLRILSGFGANVEHDISDYGACLVPLLEALGWSGRARHLSESLPHFIDALDLEDFRSTLANLNFNTVAVKIGLDGLNPGLLPCLFVPDKGSVCVVLGRNDDGGYRVFNGASRAKETISGENLGGTAYVLKQGTDQRPLQSDSAAWMAELFIRFRKLVLQVLVITLMVNLMSLAMPLFMMAIYDVVIPSGSVDQLILLFLGVCSALGFEWVFRRFRSLTMAHAAGRIDYIIGTAGFRQVLMMPIAMTENEPLGAQVSHLQEFESVREFFAGPLGETLIDIPFAVLFAAVITVLAGWLVLVPILAAVILVAGAMLASPFVRRVYGQVSKGRTQQQRFLIEAVSGMRAIKFAGAETVWLKRFSNISAESAIGDFRVAMINQTMQTIGKSVLLGAGTAMVGFGAIMVMDKTLTIGALVASMALSWRVLGPFQSLLTLLNRATQIRATLRQINHLMKLKPERLPGHIPPKLSYRGRISFSNVAFRHTPDADPALSGVSFSVEPGEVLAITGANGAGKSTILNLAAGLYRPQMGAVLIDGIDVRQMDAIDIRQNIGLVPQTSEMIYGTVSQNLRLVTPWASDEDIVEAAKTAAVHEAILGLQHGYETRLTETVVAELPEGFKQKLSLTRAYLRKPTIFLFDEPGQMLDERGDAAFLAAIEKFRGSTTIIVVSHRPSHLRVADHLMVLENGRVRYYGKPADALDLHGALKQ